MKAMAKLEKLIQENIKKSDLPKGVSLGNLAINLAISIANFFEWNRPFYTFYITPANAFSTVEGKLIMALAKEGLIIDAPILGRPDYAPGIVLYPLTKKAQRFYQQLKTEFFH